jgi:hypothetical protein
MVDSSIRIAIVMKLLIHRIQTAQPEKDLSAPSDTLAATASFGQISLVSISGLIGRNRLVSFIDLDVVSLISFISLNGHIGLIGRIGHNGLINVICLSLIKLSALSNHWLISLIGVIGLGLIASSLNSLFGSLANQLRQPCWFIDSSAVSQTTSRHSCI